MDRLGGCQKKFTLPTGTRQLPLRKFSFLYVMKNTLLVLRNIASVCLGLIFFSSGMGKLFADHAFPGLIGPVWLEDELTKYGLGLFARFVAFGQVIVGYLLLTLRFSTLGAVMLVPMVLNILVVTISMEWRGTPYVLAFFLASNLFVLAVDYRRLLPLIGYRDNSVPAKHPKTAAGNLVWLGGLSLSLASIALSGLQLQAAWFVCIVGLVLGRIGKNSGQAICESVKNTIQYPNKPVQLIIYQCNFVLCLSSGT